MRAEFIRKTSIRDNNRCYQLNLFTTGHSIAEIKEMCKSGGRKAVCFGADKCSWFYITALREIGIYPGIITDNGIKNITRYLDDIPIISPTELLKEKEQYYFIITLESNVYINEVKKQLLLWGVKDFAILTNDLFFDFDCVEHKGFRDAFLQTYNEIYESVDFSGSNFQSARLYFCENVKWWSCAARWLLAQYAGCKNISLLDVGPGNGLQSLIYKKMLDVSLSWINLENPSYGFDVSQQKRVIDNNKINIQYGHVESDVFSGEYDIILLTEVLEHFVYNPVSTIKKLGSMLLPGGHLLLTTPYSRKLPYFNNWRDLPILNGNTKQHSSMLLKASEMAHTYEYTPEEVEEVITEAGLKIKYMESFIYNIVKGAFYVCVND